MNTARKTSRRVSPLSAYSQHYADAHLKHKVTEPDRVREADARHMADFLTFFLAGLSKRLSLPLSKIITNVAAEAELHGAKHCQQVKASTHEMLSLLERVQEISDIQSGRLQLKSEPVRIDEVLADSLLRRSLEFRRLGARLSVDINKDLPVVHGDRRRLSHIFTRLISLVLAAASGQSWIVIKAGRMVDRALSISFQVTGIARGGQDFARALGPFNIVEAVLMCSQNEPMLDLVLAKAVTEFHGGQLTVSSDDETQMTLSMTLPEHHAASGGSMPIVREGI